MGAFGGYSDPKHKHQECHLCKDLEEAGRAPAAVREECAKGTASASTPKGKPALHIVGAEPRKELRPGRSMVQDVVPGLWDHSEPHGVR